MSLNEGSLIPIRYRISLAEEFPNVFAGFWPAPPGRVVIGLVSEGDALGYDGFRLSGETEVHFHGRTGRRKRKN